MSRNRFFRRSFLIFFSLFAFLCVSKPTAAEETDRKRELAEEMMSLVLDPTKRIAESRDIYVYQQEAFRRLFEQMAACFARWDGANIFDDTDNALRCGRPIEVTSYREYASPGGKEMMACFCRMENAGVIVHFEYGISQRGTLDIQSIRVTGDPRRPVPEFMPREGYYRHTTNHFSMLFHAPVVPKPWPEGANLVEFPSLESIQAERIMRALLNSKRTFSSDPETFRSGLSGDWTQDIYHLEKLFAGFSREMARYENKNIIDETRNALRCGKLVEVTGYRNYTHFDGTKMIECACRMEQAGVLVRIAFANPLERISAIWVVPDPDRPTPEFFPKAGYFENIDPEPIFDRSHQILAMAMNFPSGSGYRLQATLFIQADEPLNQPHTWKPFNERWQDPETGLYWEPFESSLSYERPNIPWANAYPYAKSTESTNSSNGEYHWGRLPPGTYRIVSTCRNPGSDYPAKFQPFLEYLISVGSPITIARNSPVETRTAIDFSCRKPETKNRAVKLRIVDAETEESLTGRFSIELLREGGPKLTRFHSQMLYKGEEPLELRALSPGKYTLSIRKLSDSFMQTRGTSYSFSFETDDELADWIVPLPKPHEGTPIKLKPL